MVSKITIFKSYSINVSKVIEFRACKKIALPITEFLPISDANYDIAIKLTQERFSNKREQINTLTRKPFHLPIVPYTAQAILHCVDIANM